MGVNITGISSYHEKLVLPTTVREMPEPEVIFLTLIESELHKRVILQVFVFIGS
jgi:hypothetical protein